jgi:hypothetical protein
MPLIPLGSCFVAMSELGRWEPLTVADTIETFSSAGFRWWISGGLALELHVGRSWRDHDDTDVGVARRDVTELRRFLVGWDIHIATRGRLESWNGGELSSENHQNNLWCRRHVGGPWVLDVTIADGDSVAWAYRRDPRVRIPWGDAVLTTGDGVPYLAPELQLLFKSRDMRAKDELDAEQVIPELGPDRRDRLARLLPLNHPWQVHLVPD